MIILIDRKSNYEYMIQPDFIKIENQGKRKRILLKSGEKELVAKRYSKDYRYKDFISGNIIIECEVLNIK